MQETVSTAGHAVALPSVSVRIVCAAAFVIGAALVFTVGFAHSDVLHNAAHDSRHSLAFPCH
jgi:cobalt transporter subunit CbtB